MNEITLVRGNLVRNFVRTALLFASILIAFLVFGLLVGANRSLDDRMRAGGANRLVVIDATNVSNPQPYNHFDAVQRIEGVADATFTKWFGGYFREPRNLVMTFVIDPESFLRVNGDRYVMPAAQWEAFERDRTGIVVSESAAEKHGFRIGQRVPLQSNIFTNKTNGSIVWDFTVRGIYSGDGQGAALMQHDYFRETATFSADTIDVIYVLTQGSQENEAVARRIDATFANSANEVATQDEVSFNRAFLAQFGDISFVITLVVGAAFAAILMVVGNTMATAVRERTREIAVLKTLGFPSGRVMRMVLWESLLLSMTGAAAGLALAALGLAAIAPEVEDSIGAISLPPLVAAQGLALALVFGIATGLIPALFAFNLNITNAFARH